ncbi:MACPF domain-containing protein CAD1 [Acorus calamus]|uniref:MACPF domain-containing protein CAD1 n=1 Tax=Acorus calamus TaxID=4465 RepID=A0AAV9EGS2_ACOCL|nr:MACPF domain-containing protein CAD1 [Acorus calamus]
MRMEGNEATFQAALNSINALGRGFDVNCDTRLLYCKGVAGSRIVEVDEVHTRDLQVCDGVVVPGVSRDVRCVQESVRRESSGVCGFNEMVEFFNRKALLSGNVPLGCFNSVFSFSGSKQIDAAATKSLAMDGFMIPLFKVQLNKFPSALLEDVRRSVSNSWEPISLARFIENYGTHIVTSVMVGGKDVVYVKQHSTSSLSTMEIKNYIQDIGDQRFSDNERHTSSGPMKIKDKASASAGVVDPYLFNGQGVHPQPPSALYLTGKEDVTVIFRRRGGNDLVQSHMEWKRTVFSSPDATEMSFVPIASLLDGVPGKDHLIRAISLYLEYKPPIEELRYFLEFQIPRIWAPVRDTLPGHQRREPVCPSLQFSMMGQKLYVSQEQISVGRKPLTGLRLCLEGPKQNRLAIHAQHLSSLPKILHPYWDTNMAIGAPKWQGPEEQDSRWFEPVKWKNFSHVSTAPIEHTDSFIGDLSGAASIVTGAQLGVWDFGSRNVLYMKLLYSKVPGCTIRRSLWDHCPVGSNEKSKKSDSSSSGENSSSGSKDGAGKLRKIVDLSEMCKGPEDSPGHWMVTGGKLGVEKGRIVLRVKYSLLNY